MSKQFSSPFAKSLYDSPRASPSAAPRTATPQNLSTPIAQFPSPLPHTPISAQQTPTGRWSHPAVAKISEIQVKKAPNDTTVRRILINLTALVVLYKASPLTTYISSTDFQKYLSWTLYSLYALTLYNIAENVRRLWWTNTFEDYPLTPSQRKLLNLPASPVPVSSSAITPPRYQKKSFTPSPATSSPLSGSARRSSASAYSPSASLGKASPLQTRSVNTRSVSMMAGSPGQSKTDFSASMRYRYQAES